MDRNAGRPCRTAPKSTFPFHYTKATPIWPYGTLPPYGPATRISTEDPPCRRSIGLHSMPLRPASPRSTRPDRSMHSLGPQHPTPAPSNSTVSQIVKVFPHIRPERNGPTRLFRCPTHHRFPASTAPQTRRPECGRPFAGLPVYLK